MTRTVLAIGAHPDDIELMMGGTLLLLADRGCWLHYMHVASGSCGTTDKSLEEIVEIRRDEAKQAAGELGAVYHGSLCHDLEVFYEDRLIRGVAAVVREAAPDIVLLPSTVDYMEDHMNTARIGVTAAFARGMINYRTDPPRDPVDTDLVVYHAMPYGLVVPLKDPVHPDIWIDVSEVIERKARLLACHRSQKEWLDRSQGLDSYIDSMKEQAAEAAKRAGYTGYAEGWRRRNHLGFSRREIDPLEETLSGRCFRA